MYFCVQNFNVVNEKKAFYFVFCPQMNFIPYLSIENHCNSKIVNNILRTVSQYSNVEWVATEKVHGANFQMITDGKEIQCAKRTALLTKDDNKGFFGFTEVLERYRSNVIRLFEQIQPQPKTVTLYGELFGNGYPTGKGNAPEGNPPRLRNANTKDKGPVQRHIYYCPHLEFYAFDIVVDGLFLPYDQCVDLWTQCHFLYAKALKRGTFQDVYSFEVETLRSWIPAHFGLPELKDAFAEGIVLKPVTYMGNKYQELFLKKKQSKFVEVSKGKPIQFDRQIVLPTSDDLKDTKGLLDDVARFMTKTRLDAVISKEGHVEDKKRLVGLFMADVIQDWKKEESNQLLITSMTKQQRSAFYNSLLVQCTKFVESCN